MMYATDPLIRDFDALVDSLWRSSIFDGAHGLRWTTERQIPSPRWGEAEDHLFVEVPAAGLGPDDLAVEVHGRRLSLRIERKVAAPEGYAPLRRERAGWTLQRAWDLPDLVDPETVTARITDGVLRIEVHKREAQVPRRITVAASTPIDTQE